MTKDIYKIIFFFLLTVFFACNSQPEKSEDKTDSLKFKTEGNDNNSITNNSESVRGKKTNPNPGRIPF